MKPNIPQTNITFSDLENLYVSLYRIRKLLPAGSGIKVYLIEHPRSHLNFEFYIQEDGHTYSYHEGIEYDKIGSSFSENQLAKFIEIFKNKNLERN